MPTLQLPAATKGKEEDPFNLISDEDRSKGSFRNDSKMPTIMVVGSSARTNGNANATNYQINKGEVRAAATKDAKSSGSLRVGGVKETLKHEQKESDLRKLDDL